MLENVFICGSLIEIVTAKDSDSCMLLVNSSLSCSEWSISRPVQLTILRHIDALKWLGGLWFLKAIPLVSVHCVKSILGLGCDGKKTYVVDEA